MAEIGFGPQAYHRYHVTRFQNKSRDSKKIIHTHCIVPKCNSHGNTVAMGKYVTYVQIPEGMKQKWLV
ncbi:unnamed protein product, partial [Owenia fusiformis]